VRRHFLLFAAALLTACRHQTSAPVATIELPQAVSTADKWIEVDLAASEIVLHSAGADSVHMPAATGVAGDPHYATPIGVFRVQSMEKGPIENAPSVFVADVLIIDIASGTGIHSMPMDKEGTVTDGRTGPSLTAGCIRVAESSAVFAFADLGMPVWIH
jgi:hypothetical protein